MKTTRHIIVAGMTLTLAFGMTPAAALAADDLGSEVVEEADGADSTDEADSADVDVDSTDEADSVDVEADSTDEVDSYETSEYDKADFYVETQEVIASSMLLSLGKITLVSVSDEMKYFAYYESGAKYDQTLSSGDGYNALGYYQFDRRYSLVSFMNMCLEYDSDTYSMFASLVSQKALIEGSSNPFYNNGELTELGKQMNAAWLAAYNANPTEFSALQDTYAYQNYYVPVANCLEYMGIDLEERTDCLKGLMWGASVLFGTGSIWSDNGVCYFLNRANLSDSMTDREIVVAFCNSIIENIEAYLPGSQYLDSWISRYKKEMESCLSYLDSLAASSDDATTGDSESSSDEGGDGDSAGTTEENSDGSTSGSESESGDANSSSSTSDDAIIGGSSSSESSSDDSPNATADTESNDDTASNGDSGQDSNAETDGDSDGTDSDSTSTELNSDGETDDSTKDDTSGDDASGDESADDTTSDSSDEGEETLLKTNDESAGIIAVLVGGFALAFGVVSGTLRRILGRG